MGRIANASEYSDYIYVARSTDGCSGERAQRPEGRNAAGGAELSASNDAMAAHAADTISS